MPKPKIDKKKVLLLVDWDNVFLSLLSRFQSGINLQQRLQKLINWIKEIGPLFGDCGYVFAPEYMTAANIYMCSEIQLCTIICPKKNMPEQGKQEDTVDRTLINFGKTLMGHPDIGYLCLASGDEDFVPLMEDAKHKKIKRILVPPTLSSLSSSNKLVKTASLHPKTRKKMIFRLDQLENPTQS